MSYPKGGIAFFDSGIGGLTTLASCVNYLNRRLSLPLDYLYYGDNFRAPYGNLPKEQILRYADEVFSYFQCLEVSCAVVACNTVTAVCIDNLRKKYSFPIIGIEPAVKPALSLGGETFVLATRATCNSEKFKNLCSTSQHTYPSSKLHVFACDELAGAIEKNWGREETSYSQFLPKGRPDRVVLGCTHYIYIRKEIEQFYGCPTLDGNVGVAKRLFELFLPVENGSSVVETNAFGKVGIQVEKNERERTFFGARLHFGEIKEKNEDLASQNFGFFSENWADEPQIQKSNPLKVNPQPLVTTLKNTNESSRIFFLGDAQVVNKTKYEQMFAAK